MIWVRSGKLRHPNMQQRNHGKDITHHLRASNKPRILQQLQSPKWDGPIALSRLSLRSHCHIMMCALITTFAMRAITIIHLQHCASVLFLPSLFPRLMRCVYRRPLSMLSQIIVSALDARRTLRRHAASILWSSAIFEILFADPSTCAMTTQVLLVHANEESLQAQSQP